MQLKPMKDLKKRVSI